ncbi:MAG TPA: hypothetical protein VH277_03970, partial [Gemmatimonadaceae bacterium]|nr:hypothetical protein [Gemmatimonadaceae bacterium]
MNLIRGIALGNGCLILASCGGDSTAPATGGTGNPPVVVPNPGGRDFAIVAAQFTQGVQDSASSVPIVLNGNAAVVNVLIAGTQSFAAPMQVLLRLFDA